MNNHDEITSENLEYIVLQAQRTARLAGNELMAHYERHIENEDYLEIEIKEDNSPVTAADKAAHAIICNALAFLTPDIPVISEENAEHPDIPENGRFWTVDPLDGTKGFIRKTDGFYVKIALMDNFRPVLGVIYQPVTQELYHSVRGGRSYCQDSCGNEEEINTRPVDNLRSLTTVFNELHHSPAAYEAAREILRDAGLSIPEKEDAIAKVSTVFNMAVAKGEVEAYLDCGGKSELSDGNGFSWDYAADWLILKNAGGVLVEILSGEEPVFTRPTQRMNAMISLGDRGLGKTVFPKIENDCV